ncbi:MAG: hypothetical protein ABIG11_00320, partial [bacterium]
WVLFYAFLPLVLGWLLGQILPMYSGRRYTMAVFPAACLLAGMGLAYLRVTSNQERVTRVQRILVMLKRPLCFTILSGILLCHAYRLNGYYFKWQKSFGRDIARFIETTAGAGTRIFLHPVCEGCSKRHYHSALYYLKKSRSVRRYKWGSFQKYSPGTALVFFTERPGKPSFRSGWQLVGDKTFAAAQVAVYRKW